MGRILHGRDTEVCSLCSSGVGHPDTGIEDYGMTPLCDVRGCHQPQSGEIVELEVEGDYPPIWVRVHPCTSHKERLTRRLRKG